ncbi:MutL-like ATPase [Cryptosporidium canis]|uniref:MutL-like ATPase n=1 Tax=Cryptosporidium canis TaxID=195482 RepID=A0A9D5DN29_9CRYT|nr:MutL-like ATPase [Cryptosporidium canis]
MGRIKKLSDEVISRIAAGEVVLSPSHALKELLENSLDAGSRNIVLQLKKGGIQSLQISDDGFGIDRDDFPMLCERFATSKLTGLRDIESLRTFGFRGEALSSISFVSRLSITSRTAASSCAYRASFSDGRMVSGVEEVASAKRGTVVQFTDLFYNIPSRQRALGSASDEYARCLDIVQKYSVEFPEISFTVRKFGQNSNDLRTNGGQRTRRGVIGQLFGSHVIKELIEFTVSRDSERPVGVQGEEAFELGSKIPDYSADIYVSGLGYNPKQNTLIIFINGRLVRNSAIKQAIEIAYQYTKTNYWAFVSITVPSETVDPNVHPTKNLVYVTHEALISNAIQRKVMQSLQASNYSRNMVLEKKPRFELKDYYSGSGESKPSSLDSSKSVTRVRTDPKQLVLQEYSTKGFSLSSTQSMPRETRSESRRAQVPAQGGGRTGTEEIGDGQTHDAEKEPQEESPRQGLDKSSSQDSLDKDLLESAKISCSEDCQNNDKQVIRLVDISNYVADSHILSWALNTDSIPLSSEMKSYLKKMKQVFLTEIEERSGGSDSVEFEYLKSLTGNIVNGIHIGRVRSSWSVLQAGSQILLINIERISKVALRQSLVCRLGFMPLIRLSPPVSLESLSLFPKEVAESYELNAKGHASLQEFIKSHACTYFELLKVFGVDFNPTDKSFSTFPLCFGSHIPNLDFLPEFFEHVILACWNFHITHACKLKTFNTGNCEILCPHFNYNFGEMNNVAFQEEDRDYVTSLYDLFIELTDILVDYYIYGIQDNDLLFQAIRNNTNLILVEDDFSRDVIELSSLEKLYRVFERC